MSNHEKMGQGHYNGQTGLQEQIDTKTDHVFTGTIYIFHAFDVGDDINLDQIEQSKKVICRPLTQPKYFRNYHIPLSVELPHPHTSSKCTSVKIYNFGALSFIYKISFEDTLQNIRTHFDEIYNQFQEQSFSDVSALFKTIKPYISQAKFFQTRSSYVVIQVNPQPDVLDLNTFKQQYSGIIASTLRFETETLSESQKNDILESSTGYFRGDLIVIDTDVTFAYDADYEESIDFFEFANIQQLELHYFDRLLDKQLNTIYEGKMRKLPLKSYLPFIDTATGNQIADLGRLKVDISVITERLESNIKLVGDPYFSEIYALLSSKLELNTWKTSIDNKLKIVEGIQNVYQHRTDSIRGDMLEVLVIALILIEVVIAIFKH